MWSFSLQAMTNLIENALNHNGPGTRVTLVIERCEDRVALRVTDDGKGIGEADFPLALRRFGRLEARRNPAGHAGLACRLSRRLPACIRVCSSCRTRDQGYA